MIDEAEKSGINIYDLIQKKTAEIAPGSEHLIYMPFLMGERTPHMDPKMRGAFVGLNVIHKEAHMLRAIMEGITYSLADCNNILKHLGVEVKHMKVCGGGSKNPVWRQIMADLYDCEIVTLKKEEGPAYGAAILAGAGTGIFENVKTASQRLTNCGTTIQPVPEESKLYRKYHAVYDSLYEHMKMDFATLYHI